MAIMDFVRDLRKDGFATTTSARVTSSEIKIDTRMVPLPSSFWQDREFSVPAPELFEEQPPATPTYVAVASKTGVPSIDLERTARPTQPISSPTPEPKPEPTPTPKPAFDPEGLRRAIHQNLASVFTGDLPYLLLKSGDRLYPGSKLTEGVVLEAISPNGVLCSTPIGILKIEPQPGSDGEALDNENSKNPLPLDPPNPETESKQPPPDSSKDIVM